MQHKILGMCECSGSGMLRVTMYARWMGVREPLAVECHQSVDNEADARGT